MNWSIVVVTWRCADHLERLVESMNRHLAPAPPQLVVVDNASDDDPETVARHWHGETRFIGRADNAGFGAANNEGVAAAGGDALVLLNPDSELVDDSLIRLASLAGGMRALVGPRLLWGDGSVQPSAAGPPAGGWPWIGALVPGAVQPPPVRARCEPWRLSRLTRVSWLTGACVAGPRDVMKRLGPFDPAIHLFGEDMDLGLRAAAEHIPSYIAPETCRVVHHGGASAMRRFADGGDGIAALNRRAVVRRAYGPTREARAWRADKLRLWLRATAKSALRLDSRHDRSELGASRAARAFEPLTPLR